MRETSHAVSLALTAIGPAPALADPPEDSPEQPASARVAGRARTAARARGRGRTGLLLEVVRWVGSGVGWVGRRDGCGVRRAGGGQAEVDSCTAGAGRRGGRSRRLRRAQEEEHDGADVEHPRDGLQHGGGRREVDGALEQGAVPGGGVDGARDVEGEVVQAGQHAGLLQVVDAVGEDAARDDDQRHAGPLEERAEVDLQGPAVDEPAEQPRRRRSRPASRAAARCCPSPRPRRWRRRRSRSRAPRGRPRGRRRGPRRAGRGRGPCRACP